LNKKTLDIFLYSKIFTLLVIFAFFGLWIIDELLGVYNWDLSFLNVLELTVKSCVFVLAVFIPVDAIVYFRKKKQK
jgi:hypothetical protein